MVVMEIHILYHQAPHMLHITSRKTPVYEYMADSQWHNCHNYLEKDMCNKKNNYIFVVHVDLTRIRLDRETVKPMLRERRRWVNLN